MLLPPLLAPFASTLNPYVQQADEAVIDWVDSFRLAPQPDWAVYYRKAKFTWFAARCFPGAPLSALTLAAEFNVWLFLLDDSCDEVPPGRKYAYIRKMSAELTLALSGYAPAFGRPAPLVSALSDLWKRLRTFGNRSWQDHFVDCMILYLDACKLEATFLDLQHHPTVDSYTRNRPYLGAVHLEPALSLVLCDIDLKERLGTHPLLEAITLLCCNIVCWSNDLFSLEKELRNGDTHNLVLVLQHERGYPLANALLEAAGIHNRDVRQFLDLSQQILSDPFCGKAVPAYIRSLEHIISANMEWSLKDSKRYGTLELSLI